MSAHFYNVSAGGSTHLFRPVLLPLFLFTVFMTNQVHAQGDPLIRINSGTPNEVTSSGVTFIGDTYFTDSSVGPELSVSIGGTTNDGIYQSERISNESLAPFGYEIPLANGQYSVALHFAETAFQSNGQRIFDVTVEGVTVLDNYDIHAQAGGINTAKVENILNVDVSDGILNIDFTAVIERAKVSAIEVFGVAEPAPVPFGVNAGGSAYTSDTFSWSADEDVYFLEGTKFTKSGNVEGTNDDALYLAERFANDLRFVMPGFPRGLYNVELHFAETFHTTSGQRIFDVKLEGQTVRDDYDIIVAAGGFSTAIVESFEDVLIADGILNVTLTRSVGSAMINAIAITSVRSVANEDAGPVEQPDSYQLTAAYPNPFNPQTQFSISIGAPQRVEIDVYNVLGQRVANLFSGTMPARQNQIVQFEAGNLPGGIYLIQVRGEHFTETQQVVLLK